MPKISVQENAATKINRSFLKELKDTLAKWQKDNDFSICVSVDDAHDDKVYDFAFTKDAWKSLDASCGNNILKLRIDQLMQNWAGELQGKFHIKISVGNFGEKAEKVDLQNSGKEKPRLSVAPIEPKFSLEQVVLPDETKQEIDAVVSLLKNMDKIYRGWGFCEIDPTPRSIVNFFGPPGTGKTMCVHAIAKSMDKKILVLNYADIESKYVGEAPKNLVAAFELAEKEDAVIFFDEADSFLGKRITNVDSGSEQAINSLRSQMLMKLEDFNGIVFFATNLHENYDKAFESRILKHIEFKLPNVEARKKIIAKKLPQNAPYSQDVRGENGDFDDALLTKLAESIEGFSGREIKNCVLESLVKSVDADEVTAETLLATFKAKKTEADALVRKQKERKENLEKSVKKNLAEKNYSVKKLDGDNDFIRSKKRKNKPRRKK